MDQKKNHSPLRTILLIFMCSLFYLTAFKNSYAVEPDEILQNPELEHRARAISAGLRCLVCQNQSIDDSDAPLAKDLRLLVRERLSAGNTDEQVIDYIVQRYGQFVLLKPPFNMHTLFLWSSPLILFLLACIILWRTARAQKGQEETSSMSLSETEEKELGKILLQNPASKQTK